MVKIKRGWKIFFLVLILVQIVALALISQSNDKYTWDEASYVINGKDLANKLEPSLENYVAHERHPFMSWLIAAALALEVPSSIIKLFSLVSLILFLLITYLFVKFFNDQKHALLSILILVSIPTIAFLSTKLLSDVTGLFSS